MGDEKVQKKMTVEEREAEVNAPETLRWTTNMAHRWLQILSDIARGVPVENFQQELLDLFRLRLYHKQLIESRD